MSTSLVADESASHVILSNDILDYSFYNQF